MVRTTRKSVKGAKKSDGGNEEKNPFALVLYEVGCFKGVVETKSIPVKSRTEGTTCMVPDPIDYSDKGPESGKKYKAKIIRFGRNIDFLYDLNLKADGTVDEETAEGHGPETTALKKTKANEEALRLKSLKDFDFTHILNMEPVSTNDKESADPIDQTAGPSCHDEPTSTLSINCDRETEERLEVHEAKSGSQASLCETEAAGTSGHAKETPTTPEIRPIIWPNSTQEKSNAESCPLKDGHDNSLLENVLPSQTLVDILNNATPSNLEYMRKVFSGTPEDFVFMKNVVTALSSGSEVPDTDSRQRDPATPKVTSKSPVAKLRKQVEFSSLKCSEDGEDKFKLVKDRNVFIRKSEYLRLPPIEGGNYQNKPREAISPKEMVKHLLKELVPQAILMSATKKLLPPELLSAIQAYINTRLPEEKRLTDRVMTMYTTDACRNYRRDREGEKQRRDEKLVSGVPLKKRKTTGKENLQFTPIIQSKSMGIFDLVPIGNSLLKVEPSASELSELTPNNTMYPSEIVITLDSDIEMDEFEGIGD